MTTRRYLRIVSEDWPEIETITRAEIHWQAPTHRVEQARLTVHRAPRSRIRRLIDRVLRREPRWTHIDITRIVEDWSAR